MKQDDTLNAYGTWRALGGKQRRTYWIAVVEAVLAFTLADAAIVARSAGLATNAQLAACALAYVLIALGALVTSYEMARLRRGR
jgi:hypothetical protein